jgi:hypothetical protein
MMTGFFTIAKRFSTATRRAAPYNEVMDDQLSVRRDHIIDQLSAGYAEDRLEVEELERRVALAHSARSDGELQALVTDLAVTQPPELLALVPARQLKVTLGSVRRAGPWAAPGQLATRVVCGSLVLDLREAKLVSNVTTIDVHVTMGHVEIIVPPDVTVDVDARSFLSNVEDRTEPRTTGGRLVRITGSVKLGNLEVETLRLGETRRDVWRRRRWERRARRRMMRHAYRHGLPFPFDA